MASAEVETAKVITVTYTLTLSEEEVDTLIAVSARIGGSSHNSPRGHMDTIRNALTAAGAPQFDDTVAYNLHADRVGVRSAMKFNEFLPEAL
jgi:hypothetical protein